MTPKHPMSRMEPGLRGGVQLSAAASITIICWCQLLRLKGAAV